MLNELASIGEFVGGFAVVVTLIYLALQSRRSNLFMVRQIRQSVTDSALTALSAGLANPEVMASALKQMSGEALSAQEEILVNLYYTMWLQMLKNNFYHYQSGLITEDDWKGIVSGYSFVLDTPFFRDAVANSGTTDSEDFGKFMRSYYNDCVI